MWDRIAKDSDANNTFLEKQYMTAFWRMYRVQMFTNCVATTALVYTLGSLGVGLFSARMCQVLLGTGLVGQSLAMYLRKVHLVGI